MLAFILMISGYSPIPLELLKRRGRVIGIDWVFLTVDWFGAFLSLMSLAVQAEFDIMFGTLYSLCCTIEMCMVVSHLVWKFRVRGITRRAAEAGVAYDDFEEAIAWQSKGIDLEAKFWSLFAQRNKVEDGPGDSRWEMGDDEVRETVKKAAMADIVH